ncbi:MAG: c-type cytochrome [Rhodanobacteraceae bacterium]
MNSRTRHRFAALVLLVIFAPLASFADQPGLLDLRRPPPVHGNAGAAKAAVCAACHGAAGVAPVAAFPNLAGQSADYLYWRLVAFKREARPDAPMTAQVATLDGSDLRNLAAHFAALAPASTTSPKPGEDAAIDRGRALFLHGSPARGVPPCQGCHGVDARGHPLADAHVRYRTYPRLRGQHADYVVQQLTAFRARKRGASSNAQIMQGVAKGLDDRAMRDIALWLESQQ